VDKWYAMRGTIAFFSVIAASVPMVASALLVYDVSLKGDFGSLWLLCLTIPLIAFLVYAFTRDTFAYTHYPIRFNRRNRQVYVFRRNGSVFKAGWDDLYWTIYGHGVGAEDLFVAGHSLNPSDRTVKETFGLSTVTAGAAGEENLRSLFEFFRIYMEAGPGQVLKTLHPTPLIMLPGIHTQKESWRFGWECLTLNLKGFPLLQMVMQVFILPMSFFRRIAMRTSKIPQWPQWVEDECRVEPDDPWIRDERHAAK
jgi:hypothetical protein